MAFEVSVVCNLVIKRQHEIPYSGKPIMTIFNQMYDQLKVNKVVSTAHLEASVAGVCNIVLQTLWYRHKYFLFG